jgi:hypothetical protein
MTKGRAAAFLVAALMVWPAIGSAQTPDFQRSYSLNPEGYIRIGSISGNVKITGYQGTTVNVAGYKVGQDRDLITIEDKSTAERIDLGVQYPRVGRCDASVNFEVQVPAAVGYNFERIASVSGNVGISNVQGRVRAESVSGDVDVVEVSGIVSASSVSGNVNARITRLEGRGEMKFSSVSGNVAVKAPSDLDADVEMSSISGSLHTDFSIEVQERRYGPGRSARGRLGSGSHNLRVTSVSGRVSLTRS